MLRTKIVELGKLRFLDDGGLVCSVILHEPPPLEPSLRLASFYWASPNPGELAPGDLVTHYEHGVARFLGCQCLNQGHGEEYFLLLEFAGSAALYVPASRYDLVQKLGGGPVQLSTLGAKGSKWLQSYCVEVLPSAYEWPGIGTFPKVPQESEFRRAGLTHQQRSHRREAHIEAYRQAMAEWHRDCAAYQKTLHADANYRQAAHEYFERQNHEPQPLLDWWVYRAIVLRVGPTESASVRSEHLLLIKQYVLRRERKLEKLRREVEALENCESVQVIAREPIPEDVRLFVWRRDKGQCVRCGSRERLEFDHIIPVIAGGGNTERNIQLLCESCNRSKGATV